MRSLTLSVPEIHCDHCKASIEGAVGPLDGVGSVTVDVGARTVDVTYDDPANVASVSAALAEAGYDVAAIVREG